VRADWLSTAAAVRLAHIASFFGGGLLALIADLTSTPAIREGAETAATAVRRLIGITASRQ
jgi:hypothetical protein